MNADRNKLKALMALAGNVEIADHEGIGDGSDMELDPERGTLSIIFEMEPGLDMRATFRLTGLEKIDHEHVRSGWYQPWASEEQHIRFNRRYGQEL